jgi:hypothetical protein
LQIVSILCLIAVLAPIAFVTKPAQAQSPYDEILSQLQPLRQQLDELLAMYNSMRPEDRVQVDATVAVSMRQALQQTYGSLSLTDRAKLDDDMRRQPQYRA